MAVVEIFYSALTLIALVFIFTFHNYFKSLLAIKLGDDTPKREGFDTLNPLPHIDIFGTILLPLIFILFNSPLVIGWPKMVPINYFRFKNPTKAMLIISLSSILAYLCIGFIAIGLLKLISLIPLHPYSFLPLALIFKNIAIISFFFAFINLIPIPPMDMGYVVFLLLGKNLEEIQRFSLIGSILILFLFLSGILQKLFTPVFFLLYKFF
jgi:Zn-dependent protease